jgi:hypothetical protein
MIPASPRRRFLPLVGSIVALTTMLWSEKILAVDHADGRVERSQTS